MKTIILKTISSFYANLRNPMNHAPASRGSFLIPLVIACFAFSPQTRAACDSPDPGCPGANLAEGYLALGGLTAGVYNTGIGTYALLSVTDASLNTGVGAGALFSSNASDNTAVGAGALFSNTIGASNTAVGTFAIFAGSADSDTAIGFGALQADNGGSNTGVGLHALVVNDTGFNNAAFGIRALESNTTGLNNTAIGNLALDLSNGDDNVALGRHAGDGLTTANNNIVIGHGSGISTTNGQVDNSCYIGNIIGAGVDAVTAAPVFVDQDGKLGTTALPNTGVLPGTKPQAVPQKSKPQAIPDAQALNRKVEALEATVAELRGQLKEQAAQIQKVNARLELSKPAAQTVLNDH
jgi:hypothetical protein